MTNAVIHLITNRAGDFHHPSLSSVVSYTPYEETAEEASLREFLQLKDTSTDYYVIGAIASVYAFPAILAEFSESYRTFDLAGWRSDDDTLYPGMVVNSREHAFNIHRIPTEFPVAFDWTLAKLDEQTAIITIGNARYTVPARESAGVLYVEWPTELGIQGAVDLDGNTWDGSLQITIIHTPSGFPYTELARQISHRHDARHILTSRGYMGHFYAAQADIEKCAITYTALAWPSQHG